MKNNKGFTLIELLVVVAILGILAAIGLVAYNGYISASKKTSAENIMQQVSLAQTERYADYSAYYTQPAGCTPTAATSRQVEKELFCLSNAEIHDPWEHDQITLDKYDVMLGETYPFPIVNHADARERAIATYKKARG